MENLTNNPVAIADLQCGTDQSLLLIAGPCVMETADATRRIADTLQNIMADLPVQLVFKASFDKANRTSIHSFRGPGLDAGLDILERISQETGLPVTTDIHEAGQAAAVADVCAILQIPAFLARQTDLLIAAAQTGLPVNVKKGQFLSPSDMSNVIIKLTQSGCNDVLLCERGTFFGYGQLVNDMRSLPQMQQFGVPVIFDATHSVQQPGGQGETTGGQREMVEPLARAAVAMGVDGLFIETHPDPAQSPSDGPNMIPLNEMKTLLQRLTKIRACVDTL
ncbi:MAG: 3-deoxy-8-phosphooctulonate synthase [Planctomycetaceae bacterium]|jgi:2-dehydro-3-deoxyphosphooctonate aldolase (KDO 8-P synthase)|nr:3-deoxy-8-phosphooctulonate synthase [Planctomycetaceae bacterium]MBT4725149.1 3-deoxy-8-phosphooctulonate synthase [Planctomycetaceae bacterium]MBT4846926.1 3-deoxy-8-phosphooctulonate synthase [Planctomycetaceae bacterium]MBT5124517.1 3-deoxy-8-phosphooctulonate synthase [Planctomycetaceae bacterium]MBT5600401.1 3-deoxy-8-phosphooctulonate synthase [Planctomycetaceae bacterium]